MYHIVGDYPSYSDSASSFFDKLPLKQFYGVLRDWGLNIINLIDKGLHNSKVVELTKDVTLRTKQVEDLVSELLKKDLKIQELTHKLDVLESTIQATRDTALSVVQYSNYVVLLALVCVLSLSCLFYLTKYLLLKYYSDYVNGIIVLKFLFGSKAQALLNKKRVCTG